MRNMLGLATVLAVAALVLGCVETKQECTLNPDGSGKAIFEVVTTDMSAMFAPQAQAPDPELSAKRMAKQILDGSAGVEAWSDVSCGCTDDGRVRFKGTAYFKDLSKVKFKAGNFEGLSFTKDDKGGMVLALGEKKEEAKPPAPPAPLSPDEVAARVQAERAKFQQMRPMIEMMMARMRIDITFHLPGTLAEVSVFEKQPDGSVRLVLDGAKVLQTLDDVMADDKMLGDLVASGQGIGGGPKMDEFMKQRLFGSTSPMRARVTGDLAPRFDYDAEVKAAAAAYPKMIEQLGLDKLPPAAAPPSGLPQGFRGMPGGGTGRAPASPAK
jgi:hypothetical protein